MRLLCLIACLALALAPATAQESETLVPAGIGQRIAEDFAEPAATSFAGSLETLSASLSALCEAPDTEALNEARQDFALAVGAWGRLSVLRFGPLVSVNRFESMFFWPDARGTTLKQVQALLAEADPAATDPAELRGKSVAVQGLLALEYVLHGTDAETLAAPEGAFRCRYGLAIARSLLVTAVEVAAAWSADSAFVRDFAAPGPQNDLYRSDEEVAGEVVKALSTTLEFVRAAELLPPMGETIEEARGRRAPFWRSNLSFALMEAQLAGLEGLLTAAGFDETLTDARAMPLNNLTSDLGQARNALAAVGQPAELAFGDAADRKRLDYAALLLAYANETVSAGLTQALGLVMGFNALDGD